MPAMLTAIREKTQGIFAIIIVGLLIIPFAFWGVNEYFENTGKTVIARVNGNDIDSDIYRNAVDRYRGRIDPRMLDNPLFKRQVAENLVQQALIRDALENSGYAVGDQQLGTLIRNLPQFQIDGKFSDDRYRASLRARGQTVSQFESAMRQDKLLDQIVGSFKDSAIVSTTNETKALMLQKQTRRTEIIKINPRKYLAGIKISAADIEQYYEQVKSQYQEPERLRIAYVQLNAKDAMRDFKASDEDLKALYEEEKGRYTKPGSRRVSHILIELPSDANEAAQKKALTIATEVATKAKSGKSFTVLAREYSADTATAQAGGDLGEVSPGLLPAELDAVVNKMRKGDISKPVRTEFGYHIAMLTRLKAPVTKSFKSVRTKLVVLLKNRKSEERFYDMSERFNNLVYEQPDSLKPVADELGLKIEKSGWFTRAGGTGIVANPKVLEAAFTSDVRVEKRNSESIELQSDRLIAIRILDEKPARQKPLAEVRTKIIAELKQQRAEDKSRELGIRIVTSARKGASLASLAKKYGLTRSSAKSLKRDSAGINQQLLGSIFAAMRPGKNKNVIDGVDLGTKGFAVYALSRVSQPGANDFAGNDRDSIRRKIEKRKGTGYYQNYLDGLRESSDVSIFYDQL